MNISSILHLILKRVFLEALKFFSAPAWWFYLMKFIAKHSKTFFGFYPHISWQKTKRCSHHIFHRTLLKEFPSFSFDESPSGWLQFYCWKKIFVCLTLSGNVIIVIDFSKLNFRNLFFSMAHKKGLESL